MSSNNTSSFSKKSSNRAKRAGRGAPPKATRGPPLFSAEFQSRVERLDKLMQLAAKPTPKAPPGFVLMKDGKEPGTLEQVGHEADQAWAGVKRIMQLLNVESKANDAVWTGQIDRAGGILDLGAAITQGVADNQRTGDSVKIQRVQMKVHILAGADATPVVFVLGRSKDSLPSPANVFEINNTANSGLSFGNWDQKATDTILHERQLRFDGAATTTDYIVNDFTFSLKVDEHLQYSAGSATTVSGALWIGFQSNLAANQPTYQITTRVIYVDN